MLSFAEIAVKTISEDETSGVYDISPLPKGYGNTLANSLRRILLSSIPGCAITSVKIKGVAHEYTTISGIKEDVVEILLNLKQIKFTMVSEEPQVVTLSIKGKKKVTAKDIDVVNGVEVTTKDVHIATLTDEKASLNVEMVIEKGVGYREAKDDERTDAGRIALDADFTPVKNVSFAISQARKGKETNLDSVSITITTDGSIAPKQALIECAKILQEFSGKVIVALGISKKEVEKMVEEANTIPVIAEAEDGGTEEVSNWKIEDLPISKRSKSGLLAGGYQTVGDMGKVTKKDLLELPGFGSKSLNEVVELMSQYGINITD
ncbi:DNA-directed RNA polymerase subunit alpha [Candidatus Dojkabacteria bacterium]|jgi:DNA-directed RNA polymerase subunit alpha|nr:DNA-directed RNA polymerase subunit alpha [Candidatus Dojkabacteria bacterium]